MRISSLTVSSVVLGLSFWLPSLTTNTFASASFMHTNRKLSSGEDCIQTDTKLNFFDSTVSNNTLHEGGELRYSDVGNVTVNGVVQTLDLVVTVQDGKDYYSSAANGDNGEVKANSKNGQFGSINVRNTKGCTSTSTKLGCQGNPNPSAENGEGHFQFSIVKGGTYKPYPLTFYFFLFDFDNRRKKAGIKEKLEITNWAEVIKPNVSTLLYDEYIQTGMDPTSGSFLFYPDDNDDHSDNNALFNATSQGPNTDNPTDPDNMTELQKQKSVGLKFEDKSSFNVSFYEFCDKVPDTSCAVTGGNFLFSGSADQLVELCMPGDGEGGNNDPGTQGDPLIIGLKGQVFKFDGRDSAWYANVATQSFRWNMQFKKYPTCPTGSDVFVSGISLMTPNKSDQHHSISKSDVMIVTTPEPIKECIGKVCLGEGTLHLSFDGGQTFVSEPGDYHYASRNRIVAHNTYGVCSRRWHDYKVATSDEPSLRKGNRRVTVIEKKPFELLTEKHETMIDSEECFSWIKEREVKNDLFEQKGYWSSLYVETPVVSFHIEYRMSNPNKLDGPCDFQSLDAWMVTVSDELEKQEWHGILGETKQTIYEKATGNQIMTDRTLLLRGPNDADYEVDGPFGTDFNAFHNNKNKMSMKLW